jgi:hypothetical protein
MPYAKKYTMKTSQEDYRRLADQCRETARTVSTETERADLLARARTFDFLADHPPAASSELNE